jgi:hypothetical protein
MAHHQQVAHGVLTNAREPHQYNRIVDVVILK